jgi:16S rRNA (cytidine1402-2'-O)-methyltransferase
MSKKGTLYLLPNLLHENSEMDVLSRLNLAVLKDLFYFFVENERNARRFLIKAGRKEELDKINLLPLNKDTSQEELMEYLLILLSGNDAGILPEAGCPGVADPGSDLVLLAHQNKIKVKPLTGPSSILLALMASGFNGQGFTFNGYIPVQSVERKQKLKELENTSATTGFTQIFIETPYRNNSVLQDLISSCKPETHLCIASSLTSLEEKIITMPVSGWRKLNQTLGKEPMVFLIHALQSVRKKKKSGRNRDSQR